MTRAFDEPTESEKRAARALQDAVMYEVYAESMSNADCARRLGFLPEGWETFRTRDWKLDVAWRVAEAFGLDPVQVIRSRVAEKVPEGRRGAERAVTESAVSEIIATAVARSAAKLAALGPEKLEALQTFLRRELAATERERGP